MSIFSLKSSAFAIDISESSLKLAFLERAGKAVKLAFFGEGEIPQGIIVDSKVVKPKELSRIIKKTFSQVKGRKRNLKYVVSSLPEEKSFLDVLKVPPLEEDELSNVVRFEAENHIPVGIDDVYLGFEPLNGAGLTTRKKAQFQDVLIAAIPKEIADSYSLAIKEAGLRPKAMEIESLSIARAVVPLKSSSSILIIDFGETRTGFIVSINQGIRFTSTIPISSHSLTEAVSNKLKVSQRAAEKIKCQEGLTGRKSVFEAVLPPLAALAEQVRIHLNYYKSHDESVSKDKKEKDIEKILLCGGGANLKGLVNFLAEELSLTVELANPWVNILEHPLKEVPQLNFEKSLGYSAALGLALRALQDD